MIGAAFDFVCAHLSVSEVLSLGALVVVAGLLSAERFGV